MVIWFCLEIERVGGGEVTEEEKEFLLRGILARVDQEFVCVCMCVF